MKKCIIKLILILLLGMLVACKGTESTNENSEGKQQATGDIGRVTETPSTGESIGDSITEEVVRKYKVANESDFEYDLDEAGTGIRITKYIGNDEIVVIPEKISGMEVTELQTYIFANECGVKGVLIPHGVKKLEYTFINNESIQVVICEYVEGVLDYTFGNCPELHTVVLGDNLCEIGTSAFSFCTALENLYICSNVTSVNEETKGTIFLGADKLTIVGETGSFIETFAKEKGISFKVKE